ncbi:MAG TPA: LCP family protein [Egibacteraceae bacterium]|nr:LCP family protein [Egibacteraceae bacterium]
MSQDVQGGVHPVEPPRSPGPRQVRRARRRRRQRQAGVVFLAAVALVGAIIGASALIGAALRTPGTAPAATPGPGAPAPEQDTLLLVRHGRGDSGPARGITLLASTPETGDAVVLFVPVGTLVDIPGFGLDRLALAHQYGGTALVEASVENLLGIDIDHVAGASPSGLAALLERTGGLELEVDERLVQRGRDGSAEVRFEVGTQFLDGERLVEYWGFRQDGESELDTFPRQQAVWTQLLADADADAAEELVGDGAPQLDTSADADFLQDMVTRLAQAQSADALQYLVLPVSPFGGADADGAATYRSPADGVRQLVQGPLAGSVPAGGGPEAVRVQVLNGVGTPGIGQEVDRRLEGAGMRIVLTDNARSFDFTETLILLYREDERSLEAARTVQEQLGVGTIQISRQPQSVVDLTIVVGADFEADAPDPEGGDDDPAATEEPST